MSEPKPPMVEDEAPYDSLPDFCHLDNIGSNADSNRLAVPSQTLTQTPSEDDEPYRNLTFATEIPHLLGEAAFSASQTEHQMTFGQAMRLYPKAIAWSALISMAIVMEGYGTALVSNLYAFKEFQRSYGIPTPNGNYQVSVVWQNSLANGATAGAVVGLMFNGFLAERFGYRRTIMGSLVILTAFIFLSFFAFNIQTLLASQILSGLPWGFLSMLTTTYAAEVMPLNLRAYLTSIINLCWLVGQLTALGVLRGFLSWSSHWAYRIPFGIQWVWVVLVFTSTFLAPESPWWLVRHGRKEEAAKSLERLTRRNLGFSVRNTIAIMERTDNIEKRFNHQDDEKEKKTLFNDITYIECFRGTNLRRTEIACMVFVTQNLCGLPIISYVAYLYTQIGFDESRSFDLALAMQGVAIVGSLFSLVLMKYIGRRTLYLWGLTLCFLLLISAGTLGCFTQTQPTLWATAGLLIALIFVFDTTAGPVTYCLVAEIPSTRLRIKTVVVARAAYQVSSMITNVLIQRMLNPTAWNWRAKTCFFCAFTCACCLVYCYFRLPETRGLGFHELDLLFEKQADARKFARLQKALEQNNYYSFREEPGSQATMSRRRSFVALWH